MKYAFVECQRRQHSVRTLCRALRVSPSGYYAARSRPPSGREERQSSLTTKIRDVHLASSQTARLVDCIASLGDNSYFAAPTRFER